MDTKPRQVIPARSQDNREMWERLEERRFYGGGSHEQAVADAQAGLEEALRHGYTIERIDWAQDGRSVTVEYAYDPTRAPRPV